MGSRMSHHPSLRASHLNQVCGYPPLLVMMTMMMLLLPIAVSLLHCCAVENVVYVSEVCY